MRHRRRQIGGQRAARADDRRVEGLIGRRLQPEAARQPDEADRRLAGDDPTERFGPGGEQRAERAEFG